MGRLLFSMMLSANGYYAEPASPGTVAPVGMG